MNKKGFTLIELLAVIVVLAIIALIAVPIILNIIEKARKGAAVASARSYIKATETYVVSSELNKNKIALINNNKYNVTSSTTIEDKTYQAINDLIEIKGSLPIGSNDYVTLGDSYQVTEALLTINGYIILIKDDEVISISKGSIIEVESITLDKTSESIKIGNTLQLTATIEPNNATNKIVTWISSDKSIATVDNKGLVTALKEGTVTITAKSSNGKTATASIDVYKAELLSDVVSIGDYVDYDAGTWTSSASLPASQGQFGGYIAGNNKANSVSVCHSNNGSTSLKGWRVLNVDKNTNTVTIIHAGQPECYYAGPGIATQTINNINNRVVSEYVNDDYANSAYNITKAEAISITGDTGATTNNLRNIGASWIFATDTSDIGIYGDIWMSNIMGEILYAYNPSSVGIRPIIVLKPNIKTTGKIKDAVGQEAWSLVKP